VCVRICVSVDKHRTLVPPTIPRPANASGGKTRSLFQAYYERARSLQR
jgi:hypothetical protein